MYQLAPQTHTQMMGYVIQTAEALIVVDGGTAGDADYLLWLLRRLGGPRPRVTAWFLTHPHSDHVRAFYALMAEDSVDVDRVCLRFPPRNTLEIGEPRALPVWDDYQRLRPRLAEKEQLLQAGQRLRLGDTMWEVLRVCDPALTRNASNNSSCVLRMITGGVTTLFLGDLGREGGDALLAAHGPALRSDIVQMAHHGQSAVAMNVYAAVRPQLCLWCAPKWLWENNQGQYGHDSGEWDILHTRAGKQALGVRRHAVAKDGAWKITLESGQFACTIFDPYAAQ